jgi:hypothetical protein
MDMFYIPALASFSGSASGTLASIVTGWVTQRRKDRLRCGPRPSVRSSTRASSRKHRGYTPMHLSTTSPRFRNLSISTLSSPE